MIVPTQMKGLHRSEKWGLLELTKRNHLTSGRLLVGRTLVDLQKQLVPMRVLNTDVWRKKLKKGAVVAHCQELESVFRPLAKEPVDDVEVPAHLQPLYEESITREDEEKAS